MCSDKIIELAAKCSNPVVRNALLAAIAGTERAAAIAARRLSVEARDAGRDANRLRAEQWRFAREALAAGLRGDPATVDKAIDYLNAINEADSRLENARAATRALRAIRERSVTHE